MAETNTVIKLSLGQVAGIVLFVGAPLVASAIASGVNTWKLIDLNHKVNRLPPADLLARIAHLETRINKECR